MIDDKKTEIAINLVKRFFIFDLADRNASAAVACLSRHIELIGAGIGGEIFGLTAARDYIEGDIVKHPRGYSILFAEERGQSICDGVSVVTLKIVIVALAVTLEYRVSATVCPEEGRFKIRLLHMSLLEKNADRDMLFHSAVSECYAGELWKELVDEYLVGGIVGGYCEPGFPFYMVNQMLLDILGYDDEADFVRDIDGLIENSIHPSDYPRVLAEVTEQLRDGGQYQSQYRMRRKDGKYIWVDDRGRNLKTNDGRYAIISICIDITERIMLYEREKYRRVEMENIVNSIPGGVMTIRISQQAEDSYKILYCSEGVAALSGRTLQQFLDCCDGAPGAYVYENDRQYFLQAFNTSVRDNTSLNIIYRIIHVNGSKVWIHMRANSIVNDSGERVMHAVIQSLSSETELYHEILNNSSEMILVCDCDTYETYYANKAIKVFAEVVGQDYNGKKCYKHFLKRDRPCEFCHVRDTKANQGYVEERFRAQTGRSYLMKGKTFVWHGRRIFAQYITDITNQKEAEAVYARHLETVMQLNPAAAGTFHINITRNLCHNVSSSYDSLRSLQKRGTFDGYVERAQEFMRDTAERSEFAVKLSRYGLLKQYHEGVDTVSVINKCVLDEQEVLLKTVLKMAHNPNNGDVVGVVCLMDVTRKMLQEEMQRRLFEKEYECIVLIDVERRTFSLFNFNIEFGDAAALLRHNDDYDAACQLMAGWYVNPDNKDEYMKNTALDNLLDKLEHNDNYSFTAFRLINGKKRLKRCDYYFLNDKRRVIMNTIEDITELHNKEIAQQAALAKALKAANKANNAKTEFLSNMSHEIRTPLNAIIGMTKLAKDEVVDNPELLEYLNQIDSSSDYLLGVINDILDMSQIESGKFELHQEWTLPADIFMPCVEMMLPAIRKKRIKFVYSDILNVTALFECYVDVLKMRQMLMNILNNACKFTPDGGSITMRLINLSRDGNICTDKIVIEDTGCGMSKEFLSRSFKPFEQEFNYYAGAVHGTGLGLALARKIARKMGGDITAESELGEGSAFTIIVSYPYRKTLQSGKLSPAALQPDGLQGRRVLLAEDHELNALIAVKLLEKRGMTVVVAKNGREALRLFEASAPAEYDVILMDVRMPVMNGLEAVRAIRSLPHSDARTVPIIAMTANAFYEDKERSKEVGMNAHLAKPVDPDNLYATLAEVIAK